MFIGAIRGRSLCYRLAGDDTGHLSWAAFREFRKERPEMASTDHLLILNHQHTLNSAARLKTWLDLLGLPAHH